MNLGDHRCTHRYLTFSGMAHPGTVQVYPGFVRKSSGKPGFTRLETTFWPFVVPHRPPHPRTSRTNSFSWTCQESSQIPPHYRSGGLRSSKITTTELRSTQMTSSSFAHTVSNTCSAHSRPTATHALGIIHSHSESARLCTTERGSNTRSSGSFRPSDLILISGTALPRLSLNMLGRLYVCRPQG